MLPNPSAHDHLDPVRGSVGILVFPNPHHQPASGFECSLVAEVTLGIRPQFGLPPRSIRPWQGSVFGTRMPEAAVEIDGDPRSDEDYVRPNTGHTLDRSMEPKAKPSSVESGAQSDFGRRVPLSRRPHPTLGRRRARRWNGSRVALRIGPSHDSLTGRPAPSAETAAA